MKLTGRDARTLGTAILALPLASVAAAQCIDYAEYLRFTGRITLPDFVETIHVSGNRAYLGGLEFQILDVTDPTDPALLGSCATPGETTHLAVAGGYVYLADGFGGFRTIDVEPAGDPHETDAIDFGSYVSDVVVRGGYAYVADWDHGVHVLSLANPAHPTEVGLWTHPHINVALALVEPYLYVVSEGEPGWAQLDVLDLAIPAAPSSVVEIAELYPEAGFYAADAVAAGGRVYISNYLMPPVIVDASLPASPAVVGSLPTGPARSVSVSGTLALVSEYENAVALVDVTTLPGTVTGRLVTPENTQGSARIGTTLLVLNGDPFSGSGRLEIGALENGASPAPIGSLELLGAAEGLDLTGDLACLAMGDDGIRLADISDPAHPLALGSWNSTGQTHAVAARDSVAFLADGTVGLLAVLLTNPNFPLPIGDLAIPGDARALNWTGNVLAVAAGNAGIVTVDTTDPRAPVMLGTAATPAEAVAIARSGNLAAVVGRDAAATTGFLRLFDLSSPEAPLDLGGLNFGVEGQAVEIHGTTIDLATGDPASGAGRLYTIDVTNPSSPQILANREVVTTSSALAEQDGHVFVASAAFGRGCLEVVRREPLGQLVRVGELALGDIPADLVWRDDLIFCANATRGLVIVPAQCGLALAAPPSQARSASLAAPFPNPARGNVRIHFSIPRPTPLTLAVYDPGGRLVARLLGGEVASGSHEIQFAPPGMASGVYWIRLETEEGSSSRPIQILR